MPDHTDPRLAPQARHILPSFVEHSSWGVKESNPYNKLFEERITVAVTIKGQKSGYDLLIDDRQLGDSILRSL
jgi:hypothetical protein